MPEHSLSGLAEWPVCGSGELVGSTMLVLVLAPWFVVLYWAGWVLKDLVRSSSSMQH